MSRLLAKLLALPVLLHAGVAMAQNATVGALAGGGAAPAPAASGSAIPGALDRAFSSMNGGPGGGMTLSMQMLIIMGLLTILPTLILMMTSFTRVLVVFSILRQAIGLQQSPPNQVLIGISLLPALTFRTDLQSILFSCGALFLGGLYMRDSIRFAKAREVNTARRLLKTSIIYLPLFMLALVVASLS